MEGYALISSDDQKIGMVVGVRDGYVIVEEGLLRKSRHAVPRILIAVDEGEHVARASVSKEIVTSSPTVDRDGRINEEDVAQHYGLAAGDEAPPTEGRGALLREDPASSVEDETRRAGLESPEAQRARIREHAGPGEGPLDSGASPGHR